MSQLWVFAEQRMDWLLDESEPSSLRAPIMTLTYMIDLGFDRVKLH